MRAQRGHLGRGQAGRKDTNSNPHSGACCHLSRSQCPISVWAAERCPILSWGSLLPWLGHEVLRTRELRCMGEGGSLHVRKKLCGVRDLWKWGKLAWSKSGVEANLNPRNLIQTSAGVGLLPPALGFHTGLVGPGLHSPVSPPLFPGGHIARLNFSPYKVIPSSSWNSSLCK